MIDKADTYCGKCIKADVCGMEGVYDSATTYCAYRVEARPHGEWIRDDFGDFFKSEKCSECGLRVALSGFNFCPNCGSDNRKRGEAE